ncbi:tRNA pseudouridine(65) synthase TruC [Paraferrimonas sp. SM1919]|uniref:tRNA pseudouridine(65) synthase TruC n=1 Tax=Paraferrimonas sp. SM1919 TaxID=2662263 RepID=UPI001F091ECE|nr:tRNA pseudouridine(65) synthase TruC [Paraferrimonas sp. SM1919]
MAEYQGEPLQVIYEDEQLIAINKPAGLLVHRTYLARKEKYFAMQILRDQIGQHVFPVHRLDKPTSGVLLFTKSSESARKMNELFSERETDKQYLAIVRGWVKEAGTLDYPLKEELDKIVDKKADQDKEAQEAQTSYQPLAQIELPYSTGRYPTSRFCLLKLIPHTGRKHQLRRHMAHLRHPIIGDTTHGDGKQNQLFRRDLGSQQLLLHAKSLSFKHPYTGEQLKLEAPIDAEFTRLFDEFGWDLKLAEG